jgi:large-conductance mechanosensitive channel
MRELFNLAVAVLIAVAVGNIAVALTNHFLRSV